MNTNVTVYIIGGILIVGMLTLTIYGFFVIQPRAQAACASRGMEYVGIEQNPVVKCATSNGDIRFINMNK